MALPSPSPCPRMADSRGKRGMRDADYSQGCTAGRAELPACCLPEVSGLRSRLAGPPQWAPVSRARGRRRDVRELILPLCQVTAHVPPSAMELWRWHVRVRGEALHAVRNPLAGLARRGKDRRQARVDRCTLREGALAVLRREAGRVGAPAALLPGLRLADRRAGIHPAPRSFGRSCGGPKLVRVNQLVPPDVALRRRAPEAWQCLWSGPVELIERHWLVVA
mmetsp:Transcript_8102/g.19389  ORF Transcript_8102/g.19389 Transcript_8102/m.19389 type:complete len:222 (-) Transcript_8102:893-1558(-)